MRSMTGFGRAEGQVGNSLFTVEVKSVNHRYLDARFRLPSALTLFEIPLGERLRGIFERGAFEIVVKHRLAAVGSTASSGTRFVIDETAAKSLIEACDWLHYKYKTVQIPPLEVLAFTNRVFLPIEDANDTSQVFEGLKALFDKALADLKQMREQEGLRLKKILKEGVQDLQQLVQRLTPLAAEHPKKLQEKLAQRIAQWKLSSPLEPQRLEWEVAFYADRADITEEINRLDTHAKEFLALLENEKGVGRKLDFLTQELHREINTVGSKTTVLEITRLTLEAKSSVEKLREQVQNVE